MEEVEVTPQQEFLGLVKAELECHVTRVMDELPASVQDLFGPMMTEVVHSSAMGVMNVISGFHPGSTGYWLIPKDAIESYGMDVVDIAPQLSTEYFKLINT